MKIGGARSEAFSAIRRRALARAGAEAATQSKAPDKAAFLGLGEDDLTPPVRAAVQTLLTEVDDLRGEVGRLKARLSEMEGLADRDALTPLLNRRAFMRELRRVQTFARRYGSPASLVYFDLDGFKAVNDRYGHAAGDTALKEVAQRLVDNVRESDVVARIGGDEFAVLLVQADLPTAEAKAAHLAEAIEGRPVFFGQWSAPLHVSWGVRQIPDEADPETVLSEADAAMFIRKRSRAAG
ncbi:MAG: GGDEF domain-containing protein [Caulobacterales bacterium 68-7]|nr:MAG: GGDEF domain-containing protein [Caulobacterales bacterium 68-7]